jgi:hypothetical protein
MQALPKLAAVQDAMTHYFSSQTDRAGLGLELLPGVQKLLETLKVIISQQVCTRLCTSLYGLESS